MEDYDPPDGEPWILSEHHVKLREALGVVSLKEVSLTGGRLLPPSATPEANSNGTDNQCA